MLTPLFLTLVVVLLGVRASVRFRSDRSGALALIAPLATSALASAMLSVAYTGRDRLATITFGPECVEISGPMRFETFEYSAANTARANDHTVELRSAQKAVRLPSTGTWQIGNLRVDGRYLANEFVGRSRSAPMISASR